MLGHHSQGRGKKKEKWCQVRHTSRTALLTVDGNGNALGESEAILANEGRNLAETVGLEVLNGSVALLGLNDVELDVVGLSDRADGGRTAVVLEEPRPVSNDALCLNLQQIQIQFQCSRVCTSRVKRVPKAILIALLRQLRTNKLTDKETKEE